MSIVETHRIQHSCHALKYIFSSTPHNSTKTSQRVLACTGFNIRMLHDPVTKKLSTTQSPAYLQQQFHQVLKRAYNPKRRYQAQSVIVSYNLAEFDTSNLQEQSKQALQLAKRFVHKYYGDTQAVIAIQADGDGGKLHAHILINTIKPNGKTVATSRFNINHLRRNFDKNMEANFQTITGRKWPDPVHNQAKRQDIASLTNKSEWQQYIKRLITQIKNKTKTLSEFIQKLSDCGVTVTERKRGQAWTYRQKVSINGKVRQQRVRDFYQRIDKQTGEVKSTRGLGRAFTKSAIEHYFARQITDEEVDLDAENKRKANDEEFEKLKTLARDAKVKSRQRQSIIQLNGRRIKAAQAEEQKQRAQRQARQDSQRESGSRRSNSLSRQGRRQRAAQQLKAKRSSRSRSVDGPDL